MGDKGGIILTAIIVLTGLALVAGGSALYYFSSNTESSDGSSGSPDKYSLFRQSIQETSDEEAILMFDESFVEYILHNIGASKLHNPPLSSNTPKIEFDFEGELYSAEIVDGKIKVSKDKLENPDIRISTNKAEVVKMIKDSTYVETSFTNGNSNIELIASKTTLFSKGYLEMYEKFS